MKQITIIFIVLLLAIAYTYASSNPAEEAEHWEKVRQMDQLAERFKAETGFTGRIQHNLERMRLNYFEGWFKDIQITTTADTTSFRAAFDQILNKVLPYTYAKREQLTESRITNNLGIIQTDYYQQVNGYRVEGAGRITINYEIGRNGFSVGNGTVELPSKTSFTIISYEEAVRIAKEYYIKNLGYPETIEIYPATKSIAFVGFNSKYELCYLLGIADPNPKQFRDNTIVIDATTSEVRDIWNLMRPLDGSVSGKIYAETTSDYNIPTTAPMDSVEVQNGNNYYYSDLNGNCTIANLPPNNVSSRLKLRDKYFLTVYPNDTDVHGADSVITKIDGSVRIVYNSDYANSANVYYHITKQYIGLNDLSEFTPSNLRITTGVDATNNPYYGNYSPSGNRILIREDKSKYSHAMRHELSHAYMYGKLSNHWFKDGNWDYQKAAMDESFAHYFPCSVCESPSAVMGLSFGQSQFENLSNITTDIVKDLCWPFFTMNEDIYSFHYFEYPIASAWWSLRNNPYFPSNGQNNGVDTLLVNSLNRVRNEIPDNDAYRYKPRYFYNILMSMVDNNSTSWPLNNKQIAINNAYDSRGFHFYPEIMSVASADTLNHGVRETYNVLDSVYVHVKNCPQNTKVRVFVVEDRSYENVGTDGISMPSAYVVDGNPVSIEKTTNDKGEWRGSIPFSNQLPQGNYDIIVDVGSPNAPDGRLNLVFANDNIIDGVDGLNGSGFTKIGFGDMVIALDLSSSMQDYATHLGKTVTALVQSMIPGERINAFGFTEGTASMNWIDDGFVDLIGNPSNYFFTKEQIDTTAISSVLNSAVMEGNTDLVLPFYYGDLRLSNLGDIGNRKNIILLSDGVHFVTPTHDDFPEYPGNWTRKCWNYHFGRTGRADSTQGQRRYPLYKSTC